ncbi:hypothetical protein FRC09_009706 [Ceratobasidium sp. 395]|nr:hypothetical protein FRC09_009706 [Ceratobasidium sp. 395]
MPDRLFNPALFIPDLDANQDTPVEILHVILLGLVKYFWRDAVSRPSPEGKEILKARLNSLDVSGLGLSPLRGTTLVQYAGLLTGRNFRVILQTGALVLYGLVPPEVYNTWLALSRLGPLAFQQEINDIDKYVINLTHAIDALLEATVLWSPRWFNKPKFHILLHLPQHIRRFGPAILFATETFESYNFVIRLRSIHSNCHAPSYDISRAFARLHAVRHLVSGGWVTHTVDASTQLRVLTKPRQAGQGVLSLRNDAEFMSLMGMSSFDSKPSYGTFLPQSPPLVQPWDCTIASQHSARPTVLASDQHVTMCKHAVLKNNDWVHHNGHVLVTYKNASTPARVLEVIAVRQQVLGVTVQFGTLQHAVDTYRMPAVRFDKEMRFVPLDRILCSLSVFHNCAKHECSLARTKLVRQERQETALRRHEVQHQGDPLDLVLNMAMLCSAAVVQPLQPTPFATRSVQDLVYEAVQTWRATEEQKKADKEKKEEEKLRKAEEKERKAEEKVRRAEERTRKAQEKVRKAQEKLRTDEQKDTETKEKVQKKRKPARRKATAGTSTQAPTKGKRKPEDDDTPQASSSRMRLDSS